MGGWDRLGGKLSGALSIWETATKLMMIWMGPVRPSVSTTSRVAWKKVCDAQYGDGDSLLFLGQLNEFAGWTSAKRLKKKKREKKKDRSGVPLIANAGCQGSPPGFSFLFASLRLLLLIAVGRQPHSLRPIIANLVVQKDRTHLITSSLFPPNNINPSLSSFTRPSSTAARSESDDERSLMRGHLYFLLCRFRLRVPTAGAI